MFQEDVERLRGAYEAFNEGGVEAILERLAPEFQVRDRESSPDRETRHGKEGIKQLFDSYMEAFDALRLDPEEFIDAGDQIVVSLHQRIRGKGSGAEVVGRIAHVWTMSGGAALRLRIFADKESALEALRAEGERGDRL
jgi:ketosteroid isomerase-like protein